MKKVFAEIRIGNSTLLSTEFEEGAHEYRVPSFVLLQHIEEFYLRVWIGTRVFVISTKDGIKTRSKSRRAFKFLLSIGGQTD